MRIARVELRLLRLPLVEPFIISGGTMTERTSLVVILHDGEGIAATASRLRSSSRSTPTRRWPARAICWSTC